MEYDVMKDLRRIIRRRSQPEKPQARNDRLSYYVQKWKPAYKSDDPALRICAVAILAALEAPGVLRRWQAEEHFEHVLMQRLSK